MEDINPEYTFIEMPDVQELEAKLSARIKDLCERNEQLNQRNAELRRSAEIGWGAEVQLKKFGMIEADLTEEIKSLRFEREALISGINEKNAELSKLKSSIDAQTAEIQRLAKASDRIQSEYDDQIAELSRQLSRSRAEESRLSQELSEYTSRQERALAEIQKRHDQTLGLAQETFHSQLSELGKTVWNSGAEIDRLNDELAKARAETQKLVEFIAGQDESYRAQLTELAQTGLKTEHEIAVNQKTQAELGAEIARQRAAFEKTITELKRALEEERAQHAQSRRRETASREEAEKYAAQAKTYAAEVLSAEADKRRAIAEALHAKNEELAKTIEAKLAAERLAESQKSSVTGMSAELNVKIRELREANHTIQQQMTVIGDQSRTAQERSAEMGALRAKIETLQNQSAAQTSAIDRLSRELASKEDLVQKQLKTLSHMSRLEKEKDLDLQRHRFNEMSLNESVNELRRAGKERDLLHKELENHVARLSHQLTEVQSQASAEIMSLNTQLQSARAQLEGARGTIEQLTFERENSRRHTEIQDRRAESERAELERLNAVLQQREYQLRQYAASVSDEKSEVLRRAKALADEIKAAATLTPLKDYLALTEFELNKTEMQLRKTPVISVERPRLEASFNQMIQQRDFLKKAIASSQAQLDEQAAQLLKIAKPEKLAPIPPLPPRKTSV